ncbi:MAG: hypothetical protein EHM43_09320 [Ignavibacteriae bacterium]|nr:MAG: hypothetical protein EHM43_09320 [Ignavibacteriota bacterium]
MAKKKNSLGSALITILVSVSVAVVLMVVASVITGDMLYLIAAGLFLISGVASIYVVRNLKDKMGVK